MLVQQVLMIAAGMISASLVFIQTQPQSQTLGVTTMAQVVSSAPTATSTPSPTYTPKPTRTPTPTKTPTPTAIPSPSPTITPLPPSAFEEYFDTYSQQYSVDKNQLKQIAQCESGIGPGAQNGPYGGMFQYTEETWKSVRTQMGADTNPDLRFGAKESIETAAFQISREGTRAWRGCL